MKMWRKGNDNVPFCHPAALWDKGREKEGAGHKGRKKEKSKCRSRKRQESAWLRNRRGRKQTWEGAEGRKCWWVAVTSGVVEVFQQCASLLLSNVHLVLQVLGTRRHKRVSNHPGNHHTQGDRELACRLMTSHDICCQKGVGTPQLTPKI